MTAAVSAFCALVIVLGSACGVLFLRHPRMRVVEH